MNETQTLRSRANVLLAELKHAERRTEEEKAAVADAEQSLQASMEALELAQRVAEKIQNQVHRRIAGVVTSCLRSVFGDGSEFRIEFSRARNKTEANLAFWRNGHEESPLDASSGGKVEIASFALRLACISLSRPQKRKLLVLDEPFRCLNGDEFRERCRVLVEEISRKMGFQIIMVTGFRWLRCGKVVDVSERSSIILEKERSNAKRRIPQEED